MATDGLDEGLHLGDEVQMDPHALRLGHEVPVWGQRNDIRDVEDDKPKKKGITSTRGHLCGESW